MKILFITGSLNQGGAEFQLLQLAKLFKDKGHDIEVFAITDYDFYQPFIEKNQIKYTHLYNNQNKIKRIFLTAKKIRKGQPELIISYLKVPSQVAVIARILSGLKVKLIVGERTSFIQPVYDKIHFNLMRFSNHITVNSISRIKQLKKDFTWLKNRISFFPNIIDIEEYSPTEKDNNQNITLGFIGRISPEKNITNLIKAFAIAWSKNKNIKLALYGDARDKQYEREVVSLIEHNNLGDIVIFMGKTDNVAEAYKKINLLCLISDYEGFSNVISEALCSGVPVITSDVEENKFLIEDSINGFIVNHKDPKSIANGIKKYLDMNDGLKSKMMLANRKKAEKIFDKETLYNQYIQLIGSL